MTRSEPSILSSAASAAGPAVRRARPGDEAAIGDLYATEYGAADSGDALYPFPQFFDPSWVGAAIESESLAWMVAEQDGEVVGTFGAVLNIGQPEDCVTELFGLVVSRSVRHRGAATRLFGALMGNLRESAFTIAETRTATSGGWRTARSHGFMPLGFEPFAHMTPAGSESMLLLGALSEDCRMRRDPSRAVSARAQPLATEVLAGHRLPCAAAADTIGWPVASLPWRSLQPWLVPLLPDRHGPVLEDAEDGSTFAIAEDAELGRRLHAAWAAPDEHASGVVGLNRLEGKDPSGTRYAEKFFVGRVGRQPVIYARVVWDRVDHRARILSMRSLLAGLQGLMMGAIVAQLEREAGAEQLVVVVDVRADCRELQSSLRALSFLPTAYYPGLIAAGAARVDAVQYTRLHRLDLGDSVERVSGMAWPRAERLVEVIAAPDRPRLPEHVQEPEPALCEI